MWLNSRAPGFKSSVNRSAMSVADERSITLFLFMVAFPVQTFKHQIRLYLKQEAYSLLLDSLIILMTFSA